MAKKRPFKFNSGFNNQQNLLIFGLVIVDKNQKMFRKPHLWFSPQILPLFHSNMAKVEKKIDFFQISRAKISKNSFFSKLAIFWAKKRQNLEKKSKIQKSGFYKIFWFLNPVTRPKISKFCWLLKPELSLKGLFCRK